MALNDITIKNAKPKEKQYKIADGEGMYLLVNKSGGKYWRLKYRINGKEKVLALGTYPTTSLLEAREKRLEAKKQLADGVDPSQEKKLAKLTQQIDAENNFESVARKWHEHQKQGWTEKHAKYVLRRLEADIFNKIGFRAIKEITPPELLSVLRVVEERGALDIAKRLLQTCGQIFRYSVSIGIAQRDITTDLKGALKVRKRTHYNKLDENKIPEFLKRLENYDGALQTKLGLNLMLLTAIRTIELRKAEWQEFDFEAKEWHIPAHKMKMRQKHIVPLTPQAIKIIKQLRELNPNTKYLLPSRINPQNFISENTMLYAMYRMGYHSQATPHGFRSNFSTILNENGFNKDMIEIQLSHSDSDKVRASYNYAQHLPERHKMMGWWSDYLDKLK